MTRRRRNVAVAAAAVFATTLVGEVGLRLLDRGPANRGNERALWQYDETKGWAWRPRASGTDYRGGPDAGAIRTNSFGLRGGEIARRPSPGVRRILVMGDSFVAGVGVDEPHLITSHLGAILGPRYEVVNLGVSGYSTDQELILFEELGRELGAAIVILVMCDNDFSANTQDFAYRQYGKPVFEIHNGTLVRRSATVPRLSNMERGRLWLLRNSALWRQASKLPGSLGGLFSVRSTKTYGEPLSVTMELLLALRSRVTDSGAQLVLFNTGHRGEETRWFQELRPLLRPKGFLFLGLEGTLGVARQERPGAWDFPSDPHWNVDSHRLVAEVAKAFLEKSALLAEAH